MRIDAGQNREFPRHYQALEVEELGVRPGLTDGRRQTGPVRPASPKHGRQGPRSAKRQRVAGGRVAVQGPLADVTSRLDLPSEAETLGLGAVLSGTIAGHDAARGLTTIATTAGAVRLALIDRPIGSTIAIRIAARDVALDLIAPTDISVQNILPISVQEIRRVSPYVVRLALRSGEARLLAEITEDARSRLALEPGVQAFALIKSVALAK